MIECPIECVRAACPDPDFLEKHETFVLTMTATISATVTALLSYFLKSRCTKIKCFGLSCLRQPPQCTRADEMSLQVDIPEPRQTENAV